MMPHYVQIATDNITLRSASGHRERVVIDGAESRDGEMVLRLTPRLTSRN
ncbi:MAG: hypothetical protein ACYS80_05165 [Planctomycetota bacterium]